MAMDLFKRTHSQARSRQSSLDAQMPAPDSSMMVPPGSSCSSHSSPLIGGLQSPPDRRNRDSATFRRSSVFTLRPRSNTSNSMTSKLSVADEPGRRSSREISPHSTSASVSEPPGHHKHKSSMFASRGKKLRRQSSKLSMTIDDWDEANQGRRSSLFGKERKKSTYDSVEQYNLRMRHISSPFDFQHLTHSHPKQFERALESNRQDELVAEFWAHRASQARNKELRGIKVEDLTPGPSESPRPTSGSSFIVTSPPSVSPKTSRDLSKNHSPSPTSSNPQAVRHSRSLGSFSYPLAPAGDPMPRKSSRLAMATGTDPSRRSSGLWSEAYNHSSMPSGAADEVPHGPHAFSTPDDTAIPVASPNWGTDLEHIAEEEEGYFARRSHEKSVLHSPSPDLSPTHQPEDESEQPHSDLPLRTEALGPHEQLKSFAQSRLSARMGGARPRPLSQMSDTLGAPFHPAQKSPGPRASPALQRAASVRRRSTFFKPLDNNTWEDDIDFCYDVGADADCEFDWERMSNGPASARSFTPMEPGFQHRRTTSTVEEEPEEDNEETIQSLGNFRPSLVVPSTTSIPDLDYPSAISASTNSLLTPDSYTASNYAASTNGARNNTSTQPASDDRQEPYNPNLLVPQELKEQASKESMFDEMLDSYAQRGGPDDDSASDRHYPLLSNNSNRRSANTLSIAESSRSGPSRYSMGSSYDSSLRSASISLTSPPRRSRSSIGSLPELVHSRRARRTIELNVDRLSKDLARFAREDEERQEEQANEAPGDKTFFAENISDDENEHERTAEDDDADDEAGSLRLRHHHARPTSSRSRPTSLLATAPAPPPAKPVPQPPSSRSLPPSRSSSFRHPQHHHQHREVPPPNPRHTLHHMPPRSVMPLPQQQHERTASVDCGETRLVAQAGVRAQHTRVSSLGVGPAAPANGRKPSVSSKTYTLSLFPTPPKATR
ncbi:hypothetical protein IWX90DRAFT_192170 [Phyllosticta citrichinensis]|uniref:CRIB domain-containing protein n=1 Tax=Phyllosticta citrichinensis TaxID=1130410 RepID=A0ABR1XX92_9PEZI